MRLKHEFLEYLENYNDIVPDSFRFVIYDIDLYENHLTFRIRAAVGPGRKLRVPSTWGAKNRNEIKGDICDRKIRQEVINNNSL